MWLKSVEKEEKIWSCQAWLVAKPQKVNLTLSCGRIDLFTVVVLTRATSNRLDPMIESTGDFPSNPKHLHGDVSDVLPLLHVSLFIFSMTAHQYNETSSQPLPTKNQCLLVQKVWKKGRKKNLSESSMVVEFNQGHRVMANGHKTAQTSSSGN